MAEQAKSSRISVYYELTKPKIWYLLAFTAFGAVVTASSIHDVNVLPITWALVMGSVIAGSAAANTLTNYHDRDIDAIMERTQGRPLPSGRISPPVKARNFGLVLAGLSLAMAFGISFTTTLEQGLWATGLIGFALFNNIIIYSYVLKRNSWTNIILGGLCGGAPPLIGWVAVTVTDLWTLGLAMAGLVFIWIPLHIWSLTLHFKSDYNAVNVPMLTAICSESMAARVIAISTVVMVAFSITPFLFTLEDGTPMTGVLYVVVAIASGITMIAVSIWVLARPSEASSWVLFKFSSPYLSVLFIALMVDAALRVGG